MSSWAGRTAADIAAAVREKRVTPREVVAEHLARIEALDGRIGAFRTVRAAAALAEADEKGVAGKDVTPYLLGRIVELTEGESLRANIALVFNNARLGAAIAKAYSA